MPAGIPVTEAAAIAVADWLLGIEGDTSGRVSFGSFATQLAGSGAVYEALLGKVNVPDLDAALARISSLEALGGAISAPSAAGGPVAVATTANIALSGEQTIDGVLTSANRVLVKNQTVPAENGIYVTAAGAWGRATDMDTAAEVQATSVYVIAGTANGGKTFATYSPVTTLGTDPITFVLAQDQSGLAAIVGEQTADLDALSARVVTSQTVGRPVAPVTGLTAVTNTRVMNDPVTVDTRLRSVRVSAQTERNIFIRIFDKSGDTFTQAGPDIVVLLSAGLNVLTEADFGQVFLEAGQYIGFYGVGLFYYTADTADGTGWRAAPTPGDVSTFTQATITTTQRMEIGFDFEIDAFDNINIRFDGYEQRIGRAQTPVTGSVGTNATYVYGLAAIEGSLVQELGIFALVDGTVTVAVFDKSGDTFTISGSPVNVAVTTGLNTLTSADFGNIYLSAGQHIGLCPNSTDLLAYTTGGGDTGGYYSSGPLTGFVTTFTSATPNTTNKLMWYATLLGGVVNRLAGVERTLDALSANVTKLTDAVGPIMQQVDDATATATGLSVDISATIKSGGGISATVEDTLVLTAATSPTIRYDLIVYNWEDEIFEVLEGTADAVVPGAYLQSRTASQQIPLYQARVFEGNVTFVKLWDLERGASRTLASQLEAHLALARSRMPRTMGKIRRGDSLRILSFGDSIVAIQNQTPPFNSINGDRRDRANGDTANGDTTEFLRATYGDTLTDALPTFTSVQLGRADDGAGQVHTKFGQIWEAIAALETTGYTLGTDLFYDNLGRGGAASADAVVGSSPSIWLTTAAGVGADLVMVHLGMNELADAYVGVEENLIVIAQTLQAAGSEVLFLGVPRKRGDGNTGSWRRRNTTIQRAADFTNSAFLSWQWIYEDGFTGPIGLTKDDVSEANSSNHPGFSEMEAMGALLSRLLTG